MSFKLEKRKDPTISDFDIMQMKQGLPMRPQDFFPPHFLFCLNS
jgi:hypothetical protein